MRRAASLTRRSRPSPSTTSTPSTMPDRMAAMRARSVSSSFTPRPTTAQPPSIEPRAFRMRRLTMADAAQAPASADAHRDQQAA